MNNRNYNILWLIIPKGEHIKKNIVKMLFTIFRDFLYNNPKLKKYIKSILFRIGYTNVNRFFSSMNRIKLGIYYNVKDQRTNLG